MSETRLVGEVVARLNRLRGAYAWRNNTGAARIKGRTVRFGDYGSADVLASFCGRFVAVECKSSTGRQRPGQAGWQAKIEAAGGLYILARTVEQVLKALGIGPDHPTQAIHGRRVFPR